jgi:hypothetical protein
MTDYIYDIETYPNVFTMYVGNADTKKCTSIEISHRKDERRKLFQYLNHIRSTNGRMVGFNNLGFDYPVLHYILKNKKCKVSDIYNFAMSIIESKDRFSHTVWERDWYCNQLDLYKIHHFDNPARSTSLKMLEFNMRSDNIEDLPFEPGRVLTDNEIDKLLTYNKHDMLETFKFYKESKPHIEFRELLSKKYSRNFMNHNDTKIGKDYFIMVLEESIPGVCYNGRKINQTKREYIDLKDCIFNYVQFKRPEFQSILNWIKNQRITETKGVFTDILESDLGDVAKYAKMRTKRQKLFKEPSTTIIEKYRRDKPLCWFTEELLKSGKKTYWVNWNVVDSLNVIVNGFEFVFGTGGIHGSVESKIIVSNEEEVIHDEDVASYYPNIGIKNRVFPEHLTEKFCDIYEDVYNQRKSYPKGTVENAMLKLALNGVYGDSNNKYSPFYDPKYTMTITINGQLMLCMLAEELMEIPSLKLIQINTDGLTFKCNRNDLELAKHKCKQWEELTQLELEGVDYKAMYIRDVNNYIAEYEDGKLKNKGAYQWDNLGYHQNHSSLVIPQLAEKVLVNGDDPIKLIKNHDNKYDFMMRTKVPRSSKLVLVKEKEEVKLQNICRYYISNDGGELVKIMPPVKPEIEVDVFVNEEGNEYLAKNKTEYTKYNRKYQYKGTKVIKCDNRRIGINTGNKVKVCNDIDDYDGDINYEYYLNEINKLTDLTKE